jgi:drug/metabolite transporter (DMT)-like permease
VCVVGAVLVVRPSFLFGKNGSTDAKWYRRSMTSFVTSYLFGESLAIGCAVVVVFMQAGVYVSLRSLQKVPHLVVMHYFLLTATLVSLIAMLGVQHGKFKAGLSLETWGTIAGTGALAFAEQLFLTRGFQFDGAGVLAATRLLRVGFEFAWGVTLLGTVLNPWSAGGAAGTAAGMLLLAFGRVHTHWAARRSMRRMGL